MRRGVAALALVPVRSAGRYVIELVVVVAVLFAGVCVLAWWAQERLIFFPQPLAATPALPANAQPLEIDADGVRLRGWIVPADASPAPLVVYFGGNAEEVSATLGEASWPRGWARAAVNYRGYGASEGAPGEASLVADARRIHDALARRADVDRSRIVAVGRSLGTGVAVALAASRPLAGVVLISPYDSLAAVGRQHYPWLPVSLLLRHRFDSVALAPAIATPMLAIVGTRDAIIPSARSRALFDAWRGPKRWVAIDAAGHDDVSLYPAFWSSIRTFLDATPASP